MRSIAWSCTIASLPLLAGACDPPPLSGPPIFYDACLPTTLVAAEDALPEERAAIADAIELWRQVDGPPFLLADTAEAAAGAVLRIGFEPAAALFYGLYRADRGDIVINRVLADPKRRAITIAHELGHAFGLVHVSGRPNLMNKGNLTVVPAAEDARLVREHRGPCSSPPPQ